MPTFSKKSQERLLSCNSDLIFLFNEVVKFYDCTIVCGYRTEKEQNAAYYAVPQKSTKKYPDSKHNKHPSLAVDVAPYYSWKGGIDWNDTEGFYHFAGYVKGVADQLKIKIRWGGDWDSDGDLHDQTLMDLVHFELVNPRTEEGL